MSVKKKQNAVFIRKDIPNAVKSVYPAAKKELFPRSEWSELDDIYNSIAQGLIEVNEQIAIHLRQITQTNSVKKNSVTNLINTAMRDMELFSKAIVAIRMRHKNKTGTVNNSDDNAEHIRISMDYNDVFIKFQALSFQTMQVLLTQLQDVEEELIDIARQESEKEVVSEVTLPAVE